MSVAVVTGASGFVGRHLVEKLIRRDYEVWAVVRRETEFSSDKVHVVCCELREIDTLPQRISGVAGSCFYHLAWEGSSGPARGDYRMQMDNAAACAAAAKSAAQMGCTRFVGAGSVTELMYRDYLLQDESHPDIVTCYAVGKMAAEFLTRCVCTQQGLDYIWAHISNFYGAGDKTQNFINFLLKNYLEGRVPELTAGAQYADFMYVTDVAGALIALGEKGRPGRSYYVGYGEPRPLREFVEVVRGLAAPALETGLGRKEFHGLSLEFGKINIDKLRQDTSFIPKVSFSDGIRQTMDWIEKNKEVIQ